jgi:cytochrome c553
MKSGSVISRIKVLLTMLVLPCVFVSKKALADDSLARVHDLVMQRCALCHTVDGNSVGGFYPRLAGQNADYLFQQLQMFKGADGHPPLRHSLSMEPMVADLSEEDMHALATYYSKQQPTASDMAGVATPALGEKVYTKGSAAGATACITCHGANGAGVPGAFPRLAGQHAEYVETELHNYKDGRRGGKGKPMTTIGPLLSDDEIKAVAAYVSALKVP